MQSLVQIEQHPARRRLFEALKKQLAKDLQCDQQHLPSGNLIDWLAQYLPANFTDQASLKQLLYRTDVPEEAISSHGSDAPWLHLAKALLEREAQKVLFREQYAGRL